MSTFFKKDEDYSIPSTSDYMNFEDGDNRFRILGSFTENTAIRGVEYWKTIDSKRKPVRVKPGVNIPVSELELNKFGELDNPKFFWAFPVWNYSEKRIQILSITQKTILNFIKKQVENPKWGDPRDYDIIVSRDKVGEKTVYTISCDPKEKLDKAIVDLYTNTTIDMELFFQSGHPLRPGIDIDKIDEELNK